MAILEKFYWPKRRKRSLSLKNVHIQKFARNINNFFLIYSKVLLLKKDLKTDESAPFDFSQLWAFYTLMWFLERKWNKKPLIL